MREFRKKQRTLKKWMTGLIVTAAVLIFVYIGIEPYLRQYIGAAATTVCSILCNVFALAAMVVLFLYYSKYSKSDYFLQSIEDELCDASYYLTARPEKTAEEYCRAVSRDLAENRFTLEKQVEVDGFTFDFKARHGKDFIYCVCAEDLERSDMLAFADCVLHDITVLNLRRNGNIVILYITDKAREDALALSKMTTAYGKKQQIRFNNAIVELSTGRCYFLGNRETRNQANIANYVMNCELPLKKKFIGQERLPFQDALEERMKDFDLKKYLNGEFYAH